MPPKENKKDEIKKQARKMFDERLTSGKGCGNDQGAWFYPLNEFDEIVDFVITQSRHSLEEIYQEGYNKGYAEGMQKMQKNKKDAL